MNAAASKPADEDVTISLVRRYAENAVKPENAGARRTQTLRMSTGMVIARRACHIAPLVTMSPGYSVPPVTRPRGCHVRSSNQSQKL